MVSLKLSSILVAVVIKTFIVLTILDHVSSEVEVQRCITYIKELYKEEETPYEIFKKGFFSLCKRNIRDFNEAQLPQGSEKRLQLLAQSMKDLSIDRIRNEERLKKARNEERLKSARNEEETGQSSDEEGTGQSSDEEGTDSSSDEKKKKAKSKKIAFPGGPYDLVPLILLSMNKYTIGYFKEVLYTTKITGKNILPSTKQFCESFKSKGRKKSGEGSSSNQQKTAADKCEDIIYEKLGISSNWRGSTVFDYFYKIWTRQHIVLNVLFNEELHRDINTDKTGESELEKSERLAKNTTQYSILYTFILLYYKQFENIVNTSELIDASGIPTPENYCAEKVRKLSNLNAQIQ